MPDSTIIVLACDVMATIIMVILLYALLFENSEKDSMTRQFILCCACTLVSLLTDIPAWIFENHAGYDVLLYIVNTAALISSIWATVFFAYYELEFISRRVKVSKAHSKVIAVATAVTSLIIIVGTFNGEIFYVKDGVFSFGSWYSVYLAISLLCLLYLEVFAISKCKILGLHDTLAFVVYMIPPLIAIGIEMVWPEVSLALAAVSVSSFLLYIMLQSGHVSALHLRGQLLNELSYKDMLTGLQNRRCFDEALTRLADEPGINVMFADVNGLKYTNDTLGHVAGDERIKAFAEVAKRHFSYDSIFRISGDEFVVIVPKLHPDSFGDRLAKLKAALEENDDLASVGYASGTGAERMSLLKIAEERMYENKKLNYEKHPEYVR